MGGMDRTDAELARLIAEAGDGEARREETRLYERFSRRVYLYGLRHLRDETLAQDLVQDVMALVLVRLRAGEVREPDRIASFVLGTARMMARDERRRERRREEQKARVALETDGATAPVETADADRLAECLEQLSERERTIVVLSFHADRSAAEIGQTLDVSPGNVRVIRHRAVARLSRCMGVEEELAS